MKYFIIVNGENQGPFEASELVNYGLTADSYVWCEGMPEWKHASEVAEVAAFIRPAFPPIPDTPTPPPAPTPKPAPTPTPAVNAEGKFFNWLPLAIVATVLGTIFYLVGSIPGSIAILKAIQARRMYSQGYIEQAMQCNRVAMILTLVGAGIGLTAIIIIAALAA